MSCDRCGNATRPLAENNGEMLCDGSSCQILWKFPSRLIADQSAAVAIP